MWLNSLLPSATTLSWTSRALLTILVVGIGLRVREFLVFRSLWLDEIALLLQIKRASYEQLLLSGLKGNQGAPAAYLVLSRWLLTAISSLEMGARLLPFIAGIGFLFASRSLARLALLDLPSRLVFLSLCAISPLFVYYSAEGKHYAQEVLVATLLLIAFLKYQRKEISNAMMAAYGSVAIICAHCAPVILCAGGVIRIAQGLRGKRLKDVGTVSIVASIWVGIFALHATTNMRGLLGNTALRLYWGHGLAPWRKGFPTVVAWIYDSWAKFALYSLFPFEPSDIPYLDSPQTAVTLSLLFLAITLGGLVVLFRRRAPVAPYITMAFVVAFGLALFRIAPFSSRLILYLTPLVFLCCAATIGACMRGSPLQKGVGALFALLVIGPSLGRSAHQFMLPLDPYDMKRALRALDENHRQGEPIILRRPDYQAFAIYSRRMKLRRIKLVEKAWRLTPYRVMRDRVVTVILQSPTRNAWIIGAFRSGQIAEGLSQLERECCQITRKIAGPGFMLAQVTLRDDYQPPKRLLQPRST